jgi:hypothetical protein
MEPSGTGGEASARRISRDVTNTILLLILLDLIWFQIYFQQFSGSVAF